MEKKCKKSIDGEHLIEKRIIYKEQITSDCNRVVLETPIFAEYCIKCQKWGKVFNPPEQNYEKNK